MTEWFTAALTAAGHSWVLLTGSIADRLDLAVRVTDAILAEQARFGPAFTDDLPAGQSVAP
jgi:HTH-type transcriptional repressor of NAD biosynthesis genes